MGDSERAAHMPGGEAGHPARKILVVIAEDWFALSHFAPLLQELSSLGGEVVVATRSSGRFQEIAKIGVRTREFDFHRGSLNAATLLRVRNGLARLIEEERPDVVHAIALQTMVMASLALSASGHKPSAVILHLTGLGYLGHSRSPVAAMVRPLVRAALRRCVTTQNAWLIAENSDDLTRMIADGAALPARAAIVPGAGVDPELFPQSPAPTHAVPRAAYVGRMLLSKGVHILVEAQRLLQARGVPVDLALYGAADSGSRQAIPRETLEQWNRQSGVAWHGATDDVAGVWRASDIAVVPALGGDGMPRAMLEAASSGRPLVVSDVPGCREFLRDGIEGFLAPPGDPDALARQIARLAADAALRARMGTAARRRVLESYTTDAVRKSIRDIYAIAAMEQRA